MKTECDLQKVREVIVGFCNMVLYHLELHLYLTRALRYAPSKIFSLWHLVTLRDILVQSSRECLSAQQDGMSLGLGFTWPLGVNRIDSLIPWRMVREIWQLATLYWPTLQVLASPEMASQNQKGVWSPKSERFYCRCLQHGPIGIGITSIPHMSSEIFPIKDHFPMAFSDS